jgi:hypothetical protein
MLTRQLALVTETDKVSHSALTRVSAALQKQVTRDLAPLWQIQASVSPFATLEDVPPGYWPVIVTEQDLGDAAGIHEDREGQPFALVRYEYGWSLTASHECLEMLVDPFGNRIIAGPSPMKNQGRVEFLVEVCDPSEDTPFAYRVNGILVSDFYTPHYFDPVTSVGVRYSFTGALKAPRQVLKGGYLSWHDPASDHWFQEIFFGGSGPKFRDLGKLTAQQGENLRAMLYYRTPERYNTKKLAGDEERAARLSMSLHGEASSAKAEALRQRIRAVLRTRNKSATGAASKSGGKKSR